MKDRPILFSAPMVRAILDGTKTQTRRVLKHQPKPEFAGVPVLMDNEDPVYWAFDFEHFPPKYFVGDRLWVRETWRVHKDYDGMSPTLVGVAMGGDFRECVDYVASKRNEKFWGKTRVSIHMPRWASRIKIQITDIRVERLNAITQADARAEGVTIGKTWAPSTYPPRRCSDIPMIDETPDQAYRRLWNKINGPASWDKNPWVWVITFRRL